ncbi:hypothetical protein CPTAKMNP4_031 [Salmonella phage vB_SenM-AKM_NP4]|uniref:Uncharacterized protein n=2 Tax=Gelderlandvirus TaxID=1913653 RepID=M1EAF0_BPS16|nr:hypothetical protein I133_gp240 [Salmonella phage vB_SenM-S16]YP_009126236.1 hypothetical protein STP4a_027 [Salmonella phage STP4-a]UFK27155.1 hypothetical protein LG358_00134 [Escherichia phage UoN_LG358_1]WDR21697.1 hypothetical protein PJM34_0029 [Salmonella phage vB_SenM_UTK0003]WKV23376.1 hypothetical protein SEA1_gp0028 [Salmonella phage SEA1]WLI71656.1 hypothetical protein CPTAKMNP4_031 [Salmonella phage vB_SenM-AKM_NP4]AEO97020.1 hypothetical protein [Salmonella phage vB_SenM-S16]
MSTIKNGIDAVYAYKFIRLMQKPFTEWNAYEAKIIDEKGSVLKRPSTPEEKAAYTPFHAAVRSMKRMMSTVPGLNGIASMMSAWSSIASRYNITESEQKEIFDALPMFEDMVAGDSGGSVQNIASGTTTGAITNKGPEQIPSKRKRIKVNLKKL